jgi:hypothetical protein
MNVVWYDRHATENELEYYRKNRCSVPPECDPVPGCFCTGDTGGGGGTGQWSLLVAAVVILVENG